MTRLQAWWRRVQQGETTTREHLGILVTVALVLVITQWVPLMPLWEMLTDYSYWRSDWLRWIAGQMQ